MEFVIEHLSKRFEQKEVLKDIDFTFQEGKIYGLLGRNGAGKTTLFNCLNRDIKADSGTFFLEEYGTRREVSGSSRSRILGWAMMLMSICILFFIPWELVSIFLFKFIYFLTMVCGMGLLYKGISAPLAFLHILLFLTR